MGRGVGEQADLNQALVGVRWFHYRHGAAGIKANGYPFLSLHFRKMKFWNCSVHPTKLDRCTQVPSKAMGMG